MIEMRGVRFSYPGGGFALRVDDLSLPEGSRVGWTGPSGSGKTTLLHLAAGVFSPDAGSIETCGEPLSTMNDAARRNFRIARVGMVFQDFALLDYLSVSDNILLPYRLSGVLQLSEASRRRAAELARGVGLGDKLARRPDQLSQGERQRVAVCRALIAEPDLLLADEPTANLDADSADRVIDALDTYAAERGATLVVVSHDPRVTERLGQTIDVAACCVSGAHATGGEPADG